MKSWKDHANVVIEAVPLTAITEEVATSASAQTKSKQFLCYDLSMTTIDELQDRIGRINEKNGFNEAESVPEQFRHFYWTSKLALVITEVAEAIEEIRKGHAIDHEYVLYPNSVTATDALSLEEAVAEFEARGGLPKPEGAPAEMADALIRILGIMYEAKKSASAVSVHKIDYNESRPFKHGGKLF